MTETVKASQNAHNHFCEVCKQAVAHCGAGDCQHPGPHYCSAHHPDPDHRVDDKPITRMTVAVAKDPA
jgi:hypothetical protein